MNFFQTTGTLNVAQAKLEQTKVQVTETKSIHSSEDELEQRETNISAPVQATRRQKTRGLMNRKHNKDFRSVWYVDDEDREDIPPKSAGLMKSVSLENLLGSEVSRFKSRNLLTKKMISSPISARKIDSNWTRVVDKKIAQNELEDLKRKMSDTIESATAAIEYFSKQKSVSAGDIAMKSEKVDFDVIKSVEFGTEEHSISTLVSSKDIKEEEKSNFELGKPKDVEDNTETELEAVNTSLDQKYLKVQPHSYSENKVNEEVIQSVTQPNTSLPGTGDESKQELNRTQSPVQSILLASETNKSDEGMQNTDKEEKTQTDVQLNFITEKEEIEKTQSVMSPGLILGIKSSCEIEDNREGDPSVLCKEIVKEDIVISPIVDFPKNLEANSSKTSVIQPSLFSFVTEDDIETKDSVIVPDVPEKTPTVETTKDEQLQSDVQPNNAPVEIKEKISSTPNSQSEIGAKPTSPEVKGSLELKKPIVKPPPVPVRLTRGVSHKEDRQVRTVIQTKSATLDRVQKREVVKRPQSVQPSLSSFEAKGNVELKEHVIKPPVPTRRLKKVGKEEKTQQNEPVARTNATQQLAILPSLFSFGPTDSPQTQAPLVASDATVVSDVDTKSQPTYMRMENKEERTQEKPIETNSEFETTVFETCRINVKRKERKEDQQTQTKTSLDHTDVVDSSQSVVLRQSSFCMSKNHHEAPDVVELQTFNKVSPSVNVSELKSAEATVMCKKDGHFRKHGIVEGKGKLRRGGKIEISAPTLPKMMLEDGNQVDLANLDTEGVTNLLRMKSKSKSANDLLKSFNQIKNEKSDQLNTSPKFPISESDEGEDEVQVRRHQNISQYRCSKTTDFDFGRTRIHNSRDFEVKGLSKLLISSETSPIKLTKKDILKYQNGHFFKVDDSSKKQLKANVTLKSARLLNKKDVELRDANNIAYILFFDNSKDAKLFIESEKVRCYTENDNKSTITKTLLRLLGKRSSREFLEKKGIYQNEPIFGNTLRNIYNIEKGVPQFILRTMELIEIPENITSLGIYRTSGNLATIQKIRFEVDKGRLSILNDYCKDVDVLTGCLKLFFRELKEPLIPCDVCDSLLNVTKTEKTYSKSYKGHIRQIINRLPEANAETLYVLIKHLNEVIKYKDENKMDAFNLSVCWGPTIIFMTDPTPLSLSKDPMMQTMNEARAFEALLTFYIDHPEELDHIKRVQDHLDSNKNPIQRQDSKDSIKSFDSSTCKSQKKSGSTQSLNVDEVLKKSIELIETNINSEGLYKKSGSTEKINKILKRMTKKKVGELERHKSDTNDLTDSLKKYLRELPEPLVTQECVEQVNKLCDSCPCLETNNRHRIMAIVEDLPKKDNLVFLLRHIIKVTKHEPQHNVSKFDMISIWTNVLNYRDKVVKSNEKFSRFLKALLDVFDESKADIMPSPRGLSNGLLNDLKNYQKDKDRISKYDNVPDAEGNVSREATILEEKTEDVEYTKL